MSTTLEQYVEQCRKACSTPSDIYHGSRKILSPWQFSFTHLDDSLTLADAGYTKNKLTILTKHYLHEESRRMAVALWERRRQQAKYGSVSFTTFNHFVKGTLDQRRSKRASIFGPCLQSVIITMLDKRRYTIAVPYRTTELLKKLAPDIVLLRDVLLTPFDFRGLELQAVNFYFVNATCHAMYFTTIIPHLADPIAEFERIRRRDHYWWKWAVKWTARYLCPEYAHGIAKFAQSVRVKMDAHKRIPPATIRQLQEYLRANHPGYTHTRFDEEGEEI